MVRNNPEHIDDQVFEETKLRMHDMHRWPGRKPSSVWLKYIKTYTIPGDIVLDAMCGSGVAPIEAVVAGCKGIGFDQDPMAIFISQNTAISVDEQAFRTKWEELKEDFQNFETLHPVYKTTCTGGEIWKEDQDPETVDGCGAQNVRVTNFRCSTNTPDVNALPNRLVYKCTCQNSVIVKEMTNEEINDYENFVMPNDVQWYPTNEFPNTDMFVGVQQKYGDSYDKFWSRQNLYFLAYMFSKINEIQDADIRNLFLFAFSSTLHLVSKIPASRDNPRTGRPNSASLGRPTLDLLLKKRLEQNPVNVFERAIEFHQGILSGKFNMKKDIKLSFCECNDCLAIESHSKKIINRNLPNCQNCNGTLKRMKDYRSSAGRLPNVLFANDFQELTSTTEPKNIFLKKLHIHNLEDEIGDDKIDFIITDPPYANLVHYMGISSLWSVWLEGPNGAGNFVMPHDQEIIIDDARNLDLASYQRALNNAFAQYFRVLKPGSYMIVTFHSKEPRIFNALRVACQIAGFEFQNIHFQENLRAGETGSNDPADTANSDFYLRFHKPENVATTTNPDEDTFKRILKKSASETLLERGDPTTLGELLPKLLTDLTQQRFLLEYENDAQVENILREMDEVFIEVDYNGEKCWWLTEIFLQTQVSRRQIPLDERVDKTILETLARNGQRGATLDQIIGELFTTFPDIYTPNDDIKTTLEKYGKKDRARNVWLLNPEEEKLDREATSLHTKMQIKLAEIGQKNGYEIWCPKPDTGKSITLDRLCIQGNFPLNHLEEDKKIRLIDVLWIKNGKIEYAFEVENSTTITSALERCSPLPPTSSNSINTTNGTVKKVIVLPSQRKAKLKSKMKTPFFKAEWKDGKWTKIFYEDLGNLNSNTKIRDFKSKLS